MNLEKIQYDVLSQCMSNEIVKENFTVSLKDKIIKIGLSSLLTSCALLISNPANAQAKFNILNTLFGQPNIAYNNGQYNTPVGVAIPNVRTNISQPLIIYTDSNPMGRVTITTQNSIGIAALEGRISSHINPDNDALVKNSLDRSFNNFISSYRLLEQQSLNYVENLRRNPILSREQRYNIDGSINNTGYRNYLSDLRKQLQLSENQFAKHRAVFIKIADNAAQDGYNLMSYREALNYIKPPDILQVVNNGNVVNRVYNFPRN